MNPAGTTRPVIFGEVLFDHFPDGSRVLGGAPFNVAWNLQAFGMAPLLVSRVGNDPSGREIRNTMEHWGLDTSGLQMDSAHPTGSVRVSIQDDEPRFEIVATQAYDFIDPSCLPPARPSLIYHGTLAFRTPRARETIRTCRGHLDAPVFIDVNLRAPWWDLDSVLQLLQGADWIKVNEDELRALVDDAANTEQRARSLQERFDLQAVFITRGGDGALARTRAGELVEVRPARHIKVVDTVGAGDAFASVLVLGLILEWDLLETLDRAQEFASSVVGLRGATLNDKRFYDPFSRIWGLL